MATFEIHGSGNRSFVLLHGAPGDARVYQAVAELAPAEVRLVLVDLPDQGAAPDEPTASLESWEQAAIEAVEAAPGEVTVVGHSFGAWIAGAVSDRLPDRVTRFVAIGGFAALTEEDLAARRGMVAQLESGELDAGEPLRETMLGMLFGEERRPELDAAMMPMLQLSRPRWIRLGQRVLAIGERAPVSFERPVTAVHGVEDATLPFARSEELARRSARAELVPIETTSHMLTLTHPRELAELIFA